MKHSDGYTPPRRWNTAPLWHLFELFVIAAALALFGVITWSLLK